MRCAANIGQTRQIQELLAPRQPLEPAVIEETERMALRFLAGRGPLFDSRIRERRVVDGHGDLLADDIFCLDDGPRILDCLDFDDRLRWLDGLDDAAFLAMDLERLSTPAEASAPAPYGSGIYAAKWTERIYAELLHRATVLLAHGESVVADASFISARHRVAATAAAASVSADLVQLRCAASPELAAQRISTRSGGVSDADPAIARQMEALADPWPDAMVIDTERGGASGAPGSAVEQVLQVIRQHGAEHAWRPSRPYMLPG